MEEKQEALRGYSSLASGIVAINVADELAWTSTLEWEDVFSPAEMPLVRLRAFIDHFPRSGITHSLKALLHTVQDEQFLAEERERFEAQDVDVDRPDPLLLAINGLEEAPQSVLAHRIAATLYLLDRDWLSCSDVASSGLTLVKSLEATFAIDLKLVRAGLESNLASALTHLHPPQHHARALRLSDSVLSLQPDATDATLCKAHIAQTAGRWEQAHSLFSRVKSGQDSGTPSDMSRMLQKLSLSSNPAREARLEVAWCDVQMGKLAEGKEELESVTGDLDEANDANPEDRAKAWWRLGSCLWKMGGGFREETSQAFTCFITALKRDASYAPAFTSLGLFYGDISRPADHVRAAKCFQKAFELDAREDEAAHRLAQAYADDNDWDLVYLVAQRTIEGEGGSLALSGEVSSQRRHVTRNVWAWTAIGSTELIRKDFEKAIVAFQVALRSFPDDGNLWMRLGEAYTASGRLEAGVKTFEKARTILQGSDEEWQARFSIVSVQRRQGKYEEALATLEELCLSEPDRLEIKAACAETRLLLALHEIKRGYSLRGAWGIVTAMQDAIKVLEVDSNVLAAWKVLADGLFQYSSLHHAEGAIRVVEETTQTVVRLTTRYNVDAALPSISAVTLDAVMSASDSTVKALLLSVYLGKLRVLLHHQDEQVAGSAWMDLTVGLHQVSFVQEQGRRDTEQYSECQSQAIACAKEALKTEPGNGVYWSALGDLVSASSVKLAQHCYVKAIEADVHDAVPWTNLGLLYLTHDDVALAKECFVKAQTLDSDYIQAWIGQALVARRTKNEAACRALFQHAYAINEGADLEAAYGFASTLFTSLSRAARVPLSQLHAASFALNSYLSYRPKDVSALHLSALFAERLSEMETAMERIEQASAILEGEYEQDESAQQARLFAVCMVNLGRMRMATGDYAGAKEAFDMGLGLLVAEEEGEEKPLEAGSAPPPLVLSKADLKKAQTGAQCGAGIAQFALGEEEDAFAALRQCLEEEEEEEKGMDGQSRQQICLLLAQMLWSMEERQEAEGMVMEALALQPKSAPALLALGSISLVNGDVEQLSLIKSEMQDVLDMDKSGQLASFMASFHLQQRNLQGAVEVLQTQAQVSLAARLDLTRLLLLLAIQACLDGNGESTSEKRDGAVQRAMDEAGRLHHHLVTRLSEETQDYLIASTTCLTVALALGGKKTQAVQMAMRNISLEPQQHAHLSLLQVLLGMKGE